MKIVKELIKRQYELTFLIPASYTAAELADTKKELEALVKKYKGKILEQAEWGKKSLAYKIKKEGKTYDAAFYFHWLLKFESNKVQEFEKFLYLNHHVIRHLLIVKEEEK
ncbi:MAG: 30S ribosomal protein S6 [Candidatus Woesebacteria bacterium]|jgi:ribosomal protein S6